MSEHTPGPWEIHQERTIVRHPEPKKHGEPEGSIKRIAKVFTRVSKEEEEANIRLVAAAPELLEVAEEAFDFIAELMESRTEWSKEMHSLKDNLEAAIQKTK